MILEMPEDEELPLILGRPFLETIQCMIDIEEGTMTLKVYDEEVKIDVQNTMKYKDDVGTSHDVKVIDQVIAQGIPIKTPQLPLERVLSLSIFENDEEKYNFSQVGMIKIGEESQIPRLPPEKFSSIIYVSQKRKATRHGS